MYSDNLRLRGLFLQCDETLDWTAQSHGRFFANFFATGGVGDKTRVPPPAAFDTTTRDDAFVPVPYMRSMPSSDPRRLNKTTP